MKFDLVAWARESFDLGDEDVSITPGARGELCRLAARRRVYALKQVSAGVPPARGEVESEVAFARRAAAAGVRLPASHPDRNGKYVVPLTNGGWLRLYDWVELRSADLAATAEALGILLARLHRCAPPVDRDLNGARPVRWYEVPPDQDGWAPLVTAAAEAGMSWATRLAAARTTCPLCTPSFLRLTRPGCGCATATCIRGTCSSTKPVSWWSWTGRTSAPRNQRRSWPALWWPATTTGNRTLTRCGGHTGPT